MTTKRFFFLMVAVSVVLPALILTTIVGGNKLLQSQASKLADLRAQNQVVEDQKIALVRGKEDIERYSDLDEIAKAVVPQDKDQARTIREINAIAAESGISLQAVTFTESSLGEAAQSSVQNKNQTSGTSSTAQQTPQNQSGLTQVTPVEDIPGVYALQITISPAVNQPIPYQQFLDFLERLENNRRTAHVDNISVTPVEGSSGITFTLTLNVYVKP
jgi:hypothetical protein